MEAAEEAARQTIGAFKTVFRKLEPRLAIHGAVAWGSLDAVHLDLRFEGEGKVGENNLKTKAPESVRVNSQRVNSRQVTAERWCGPRLSTHPMPVAGSLLK